MEMLTPAHSGAYSELGDEPQERRFNVLIVGQNVADVQSVRQAFPTSCDVEDFTLSDADLMHPRRVLDGTEWRYKIRDADLVVMAFDCAGERIPVLGSYGKLQPIWEMCTAEDGGSICPIVFVGTRERTAPPESVDAYPLRSFPARIGEMQFAKMGAASTWNAEHGLAGDAAAEVPSPPLIVWNQTASAQQRSMLATVLFNTVKQLDEDDGRDHGYCYVRWDTGPKGGVVICNSFRAPKRCRKRLLNWRQVGAISVVLLVGIILAGIYGPPRKTPPPVPKPPPIVNGIAVVLQMKGVSYSTVYNKHEAIASTLAAQLKTPYTIVVPEGGVVSLAPTPAPTPRRLGEAAGAFQLDDAPDNYSSDAQYSAAPADKYGANITLIAQLSKGQAIDVAAQELLQACLVKEDIDKFLGALKQPSVGLGTSVTFKLVDVLQEEDINGVQKGSTLHQPFLLKNSEYFIQVFQASEPLFVYAWPLPPAGTRCTVQIQTQKQGADALIEIHKDQPYISIDNPRASFSVTASCGGLATLTYSFTCEPAANLEFKTTSNQLKIHFANIEVPSFMQPIPAPSPYTAGIPFFAGHSTTNYTTTNPGAKQLVFSVDQTFMPKGSMPLEVKVTPGQGIEFTPNPIKLTPSAVAVPVGIRVTNKPCSSWTFDASDAVVYPLNDTSSPDCAWQLADGLQPSARPAFQPITTQHSIVDLGIDSSTTATIFTPITLTLQLTPAAVDGLTVVVHPSDQGKAAVGNTLLVRAAADNATTMTIPAGKDTLSIQITPGAAQAVGTDSNKDDASATTTSTVYAEPTYNALTFGGADGTGGTTCADGSSCYSLNGYGCPGAGYAQPTTVLTVKKGTVQADPISTDVLVWGQTRDISFTVTPNNCAPEGMLPTQPTNFFMQPTDSPVSGGTAPVFTFDAGTVGNTQPQTQYTCGASSALNKAPTTARLWGDLCQPPVVCDGKNETVAQQVSQSGISFTRLNLNDNTSLAASFLLAPMPSSYTVKLQPATAPYTQSASWGNDVKVFSPAGNQGEGGFTLSVQSGSEPRSGDLTISLPCYNDGDSNEPVFQWCSTLDCARDSTSCKNNLFSVTIPQGKGTSNAFFLKGASIPKAGATIQPIPFQIFGPDVEKGHFTYNTPTSMTLQTVPITAHGTGGLPPPTGFPHTCSAGWTVLTPLLPTIPWNITYSASVASNNGLSVTVTPNAQDCTGVTPGFKLNTPWAVTLTDSGTATTVVDYTNLPQKRDICESPGAGCACNIDHTLGDLNAFSYTFAPLQNCLLIGPAALVSISLHADQTSTTIGQFEILSLTATATPAGYTPPGLTLTPTVSCSSPDGDASNFYVLKGAPSIQFNGDSVDLMTFQALEGACTSPSTDCKCTVSFAVSGPHADAYAIDSENLAAQFAFSVAKQGVPKCDPSAPALVPLLTNVPFTVTLDPGFPIVALPQGHEPTGIGMIPAFQDAMIPANEVCSGIAVGVNTIPYPKNSTILTFLSATDATGSRTPCPKGSDQGCACPVTVQATGDTAYSKVPIMCSITVTESAYVSVSCTDTTVAQFGTLTCTVTANTPSPATMPQGLSVAAEITGCDGAEYFQYDDKAQSLASAPVDFTFIALAGACKYPSDPSANCDCTVQWTLSGDPTGAYGSVESSSFSVAQQGTAKCPPAGSITIVPEITSSTLTASISPALPTTALPAGQKVTVTTTLSKACGGSTALPIPSGTISSGSSTTVNINPTTDRQPCETGPGGCTCDVSVSASGCDAYAGTVVTCPDVVTIKDSATISVTWSDNKLTATASPTGSVPDTTITATVQSSAQPGGCNAKFFTGQGAQKFTPGQDTLTWDLTPSNGQGTPIMEGACNAFTDEKCTCTVTFAVDPPGPYGDVASVDFPVPGFKFIPNACSGASPVGGEQPFTCYQDKSSWPNGDTQSECQTACAGCICGGDSALNTCPQQSYGASICTSGNCFTCPSEPSGCPTACFGWACSQNPDYTCQQSFGAPDTQSQCVSSCQGYKCSEAPTFTCTPQGNGNKCKDCQNTAQDCQENCIGCACGNLNACPQQSYGASTCTSGNCFACPSPPSACPTQCLGWSCTTDHSGICSQNGGTYSQEAECQTSQTCLTPAPTPVPPTPAPKYKCGSKAQCVPDDGGQYTTPDCNKECT